MYHRSKIGVSQLRIGYLYDFKAYPPRGGNHRHVIELTQGFVELGHFVSVVDDPTMPGVTNYGGDSAGLKRFVNSIDVLYVRIDACYTRRWSALVECMSLAGNRPVVWEINAPANEGQAYSWLGGRSLDQILGGESSVRWLRRWRHAAWKLPGIVLEERHRQGLAKGVYFAVCVSSALGKYATEGVGVSNVLVLPNGGPLITKEEICQRRERRQRKGYSVLYSGSGMKYPWQGLDYLSRVIALAEREAPDLTFVLAVNERTPNLPTSNNVVILECLDREEILDVICAADVCVSLHPEYPWSKHGFHNSPMKLFEYMACMRPVVTSNHGQMKEIIRDGVDGILCENSPKDILSKLVFLRDNPEQASSIGWQAWKRIQSDFNWRRNVTETLQVFKRALA